VPLTADALLTLKLPVDELVVVVFVAPVVPVVPVAVLDAVVIVPVFPVVAVVLLLPPQPTTNIDTAKRVLRIKT
jgi:hypothetical protein